LAGDDVADALELVMKGEASATQIAAFLMGLRVRGDTAETVAGAARALRRAMVPLAADDPESLVDTCGTGGGTVRTFNISTAAALVAGGAGVRIAKHGNRSFTSSCGSADVLEALGVRIDVPVATMERALREAGIVFMFAPLMHPAMRHVGPVRRELAVPTVMNVVGPLANPAGAGRQVVGVADASRVPVLAGALAALGARHALVVHGEPGLDEFSPLGPTRVLEIRDGEVTEWTLDPARFDLTAESAEELAGASPEENARVILDVLGGRGTRGARAAVLLNAAAAVYVSGRVSSFDAAVEQATHALESGAGTEVLERLRVAYQ
ncbi:MAG TPA: anthranilate phosphoribosyltransferase, partial [Gemmatimonadaceae bacterium]